MDDGLGPLRVVRTMDWSVNGLIAFTAYPTDCTYGTGTMNGSFEFVAETEAGTANYTQTKGGFSGLPAVKVIISGT